MYNFSFVFPTFLPHCTAWSYSHASCSQQVFFVSSPHKTPASLHIDAPSWDMLSSFLPLQHPCSFFKANLNTYVAFPEFCRQEKKLSYLKLIINSILTYIIVYYNYLHDVLTFHLNYEIIERTIIFYLFTSAAACIVVPGTQKAFSKCLVNKWLNTSVNSKNFWKLIGETVCCNFWGIVYVRLCFTF